MAMRATTAALAAAAAAPRGGFLRLFSTTSTSSSSFPFPQATQQTPAREQAEPNTNLFVSGLSKRTTSEGLREAFSKFGEVVQARVVTDRVSGYSKGFGFVKYATLEDAAEGIKGMDGQVSFTWLLTFVL
ncbi:organelle RRM domain-containing protein 2 [Populus alba x Populus x berolinensis]|nr:organelle RRM domain-containing protein 2 [Populus alba x Populus x berolinensis]